MASGIPDGIETLQQYFQQEHYGPFSRPVPADQARGSAWLIHGFWHPSGHAWSGRPHVG